MQNKDFYFETSQRNTGATYTVLSITFDVELRIEIYLKRHNLDFEGFNLIYNIAYFGYFLS